MLRCFDSGATPHNIIPEDDITIDSIDVGNHTWGKVISLTGKCPILPIIIYLMN